MALYVVMVSWPDEGGPTEVLDASPYGDLVEVRGEVAALNAHGRVEGARYWVGEITEVPEVDYVVWPLHEDMRTDLTVAELMLMRAKLHGAETADHVFEDDDDDAFVAIGAVDDSLPCGQLRWYPERCGVREVLR